MTSNIGAEKLQKEADFGFQVSSNDDMKDLDNLHQSNKSKVLDELKKVMRPELLNRIDKTIVFRALTKKDISNILDIQLDELRSRLVKRGIGLKILPKAKKYLIEQGYDARNGARPMRRLIQDSLEDHIATGLLDDMYPKGSIIQVTLESGKLKYDEISEISDRTHKIA